MRHATLVAGAAVLLATVGLSLYATRLNDSEMVHFSLAVPVGRISRPVVLRGAGRPMRLAPVRVDLDERGFLKRWLQPGVEGFSTHTIRNVGQRPLRIRLELAPGPLAFKWEVNANAAYDPRTRSFTEPLPPGRAIPNLSIDWLFDVPPSGRAGVSSPGGGALLYDGGLRLLDADSDETLTFLPIRIGRGSASQQEAAPCH